MNIYIKLCTVLLFQDIIQHDNVDNNLLKV